MNMKSVFKIINATLALISGSQSALAQQQDIEKKIVVTLGVQAESFNDASEAAESLEKLLQNSENSNFALNLDSDGLKAKIVVKNEGEKNLDLLIKKLNSQLKKKVVIIEVEPAKITNGTQDDL